MKIFDLLPFDTATLAEWPQWALAGGFALLAALFAAYLLKKLVWRIFGISAALEHITSQRKSSEVRTAKVVELFAPLLDQFPVDVKKPGTSTVFLGQPVDFVHFDPDKGITFIEIKSGDARLTDFQAKIRARIESGDIHWAEMQIKGDPDAALPLKKTARR